MWCLYKTCRRGTAAKGSQGRLGASRWDWLLGIYRGIIQGHLSSRFSCPASLYVYVSERLVKTDKRSTKTRRRKGHKF